MAGGRSWLWWDQGAAVPVQETQLPGPPTWLGAEGFGEKSVVPIILLSGSSRGLCRPQRAKPGSWATGVRGAGAQRSSLTHQGGPVPPGKQSPEQRPP